MTKEVVNLAEVAHVIGFSANGPRGETELSAELARDVTNLMLLCGDCHKDIDANKRQYPTPLLGQMKESHERHVELVTSIARDKQSHVLLYGANVGQHSSPVNFGKASVAMIPDWYPASRNPLNIGMINSAHTDDVAAYWEIEGDNLRKRVTQQVKPQLADGTIKHLSIFALAPQPLLIMFGSLISDIPAAEVYQLHREPPDWKWQEHPATFDYIIQEPASKVDGDPALVIALSATITDDRVKAILGVNASIWRMSILDPNNDFLKSREQLRMFRQRTRHLLDRIKATHGEYVTLHVFPAMPVAAAVEFGRIVMPKADLPLKIYDQNTQAGGFVYALSVNSSSHID